MEKYIKQLINDFKAVSWNLKEPSNLWDSADLDNENENEVEDLSYIEEFVYGEEKKISEITGIETIQLPPVEKLSEEQASLLAWEMYKLLNFFHFYPLFPAILPGKIRYRVLREKWESKQVPVSFGRVHLEFCDYDEKNCPFPGYCTTCKKIRKEVENSPKADDHFPIEGLLPSKEEIEDFLFEQKKEEIKEKIKNHVPDKNHIPGISNYCDRWCERCPFTARCASFSLSNDLNLEENDLSNKEFWDDLRAMFGATGELFTDLTREYGFDPAPNSIEPENRKATPSPLLIETAEAYASKITGWLKENSNLIDQTENELFSSGSRELFPLLDAMEEIQWYHLFIPAKIHRAFSHFDDQDITEFAMNDANGSAKIALVAIEHSIEAFSVILKSMEEKEDEILQFMISLSKMRKDLELAFPEARSFIRPGLDEEDTSLD